VDRLRERLSLAAQAIETLGELACLQEPSEVQRDAAIQRFEYSFEASWKAAQRFLRVVEGVEAGSPKAVIRACREAGLLDDSETEQALGMADDRNLTAHTYNESLAAAIFSRLPQHLRTLEAWCGAMTARISPRPR
jgi:nucleotidyltransferase substrate binding protein (TIGR01987 family)